MQTSARNQLAGTVVSMTIGAVMAEVVVDIGGQHVAAAITKDSGRASRARRRRSGHRDHQGHRRDDRRGLLDEGCSGRFTIALVAFTVATASMPGSRRS